jgi:NUMOD4 motif/Helix-turn-helix domain of resolvase/HNH endonuclease
MTKNLLGEIWKNVDLHLDFKIENRLEVSNKGRIRTFNKVSDGNVIDGSLINGYKIIRLKVFRQRDEATENKFAYLNKQILKFSEKIKKMQEAKESKTAIKEAESLLKGLKENLSKKYAADAKLRTTHYHSLIHRLVAECFLRKTSSMQTIVAHLDFDKLNNKASNLKWMTQAENVIHQRNSPFVIAEKANRRISGAKNTRTTKLSVTKVMLIKKLLNEGKPVKSLVKQFKVSDMQIYRVKSGENWGDVPAAK